MKLSTFQQTLQTITHPIFVWSDGSKIPSHYHITEIWLIYKRYIDCWGELRNEMKISMQLRYADDLDHRLTSEKLLKIIDIYTDQISAQDLDIEVEYQADTIGKYWLTRDDGIYTLTPTQTDCLAKDACGIPQKQQKSCCGVGCC